MKIAILGWGSLIWCPGSLAIRTAWHADGPQLPIEFARISDDERLTLVILPGRQKQPTYWALSSFDKLELAKANLQKREGCKRASDIHCAVASQGSGSDDKIVSEVSAWLKDKPDLDAAAWTGLTSNWEEKKSKQFGAREALESFRLSQAQEGPERVPPGDRVCAERPAADSNGGSAIAQGPRQGRRRRLVRQ